MIPRILEYEDGRIRVTPEAYTIPEIKAIIDKHDMLAEPYLALVYNLSYPDSLFVRLPEDERKDSAIFDIQESLGDFDSDDELIEPAIEKLRSYWVSPTTLMADELDEEVHRWRKGLRDTPLDMSNPDSARIRMDLMKNVEKIVEAAINMRKKADAEIGPKMKGSNEMGEY